MTIGPKRGKGPRPTRLGRLLRDAKRARVKRPQGYRKVRWRKGP